MERTLVMFSVLMSALLFCSSASGNFAFAKSSDIVQKKKQIENARALAEELRKKALEKLEQELKTKQDVYKKQIALSAIKKQDSKLKKIGSN